MKDRTWKKIDKLMFNFYSRLFKGAVKKLKFKKHKFHIYKYLLHVQLIVIFGYSVTGTIDILSNHKNISTIITALITTIIMLDWVINYWRNNKFIRVYTPIFRMRKNPGLYKIHKAHCKLRLSDQTKARRKEFPFRVSIGIIGIYDLILFLAIGGWSHLGLSLYFMYCIFLEFAGVYIHCIFDFDPPTKKRKKKKSKVTNIGRKRWRDSLRVPVLKPFPI